jgi:hypothetical protein
MALLLVVEAKPAFQVSGKFIPRFIRFQVDAFVFQRAPQPFDEDVVFEAPFAVHADPDVPGLEDGSERFAGELAALVGVEHFWRAELENSLFQGLDAEPRV